MNKEFIPYQQALELKQLGFDESCFGWYSTKGVFYSDTNANRTIELNTITNRGSFANAILAPLYQQAFRWFREKYNLFSAVNVDQTMEPKFAYCISQYESIQFFDGWDTIVFNSELYYTYEEAELECLKKLIEIVKTK